MKIGIFDSGLGGLIIAKSIMEKLPQYDVVFLADTARVPYGDRSEAAIYKYAKQAAEFLFKKDCQLIIFACNTVSASALRKLQQNYLPKHYPNRRILGVIVPTVEQAKEGKKIGVMATSATVKSKAYIKELKKLNKNVKVYQKAAPKLVPLLERNELDATDPWLTKYLQPLLKQGIDSLILGCTHYAWLTHKVKHITGSKIKVYDQKNIIPQKLKSYLQRHPEIRRLLGTKRKREFYLTQKNKHFTALAKQLIGHSIELKQVGL